MIKFEKKKFPIGESLLRHSIRIPLIGDGLIFTGVGDLFAALFLAHSTTKASLNKALEYTIATLQAVLKNTLQGIQNGKNFSSKYYDS